eukprot:Awhi_evm1s10098
MLTSEIPLEVSLESTTSETKTESDSSQHEEVCLTVTRSQLDYIEKVIEKYNIVGSVVESKTKSSTLHTATDKNSQDLDSSNYDEDSRTSKIDEGALAKRKAISWAISQLINHCNQEEKKIKRLIFRVIRCQNCTQATTGGFKAQVTVDLEKIHLQWLQMVKVNCDHASVDKTIRIMLDFYIALAKKDSNLESLFFNPKHDN